MLDGSTLNLSGIVLSGDSLWGNAEAPPRRVAVPVAHVRRIEERRLSAGRTTAAGLGIAATVALVALVVIGASQGFGIGY